MQITSHTSVRKSDITVALTQVLRGDDIDDCDVLSVINNHITHLTSPTRPGVFRRKHVTIFRR